MSGYTGRLRRDSGHSTLLVPILLGGVLIAYFGVPFVTFLLRTGHADVLAGLAEPGAQAAIRHSLLTATIATVVATGLGVPLAYVLARRSFAGKRLLEGLVVLPLVLPPVVAGAMILTAVGRFTPLGSTLAAVGVSPTQSLFGVVLAQTFVAAPFVVVTARAGFAAVDERLERASRSLGYTPLETFRYVALPLARGAVLAGVTLTFARAMGEFGATYMVASNPRTMPTYLWVEFIKGGLDSTVPVALALLAVTLLVLGVVQWFGRVPAVIDR
ncbi:ABC transporter permease [Halapricum hydrolyticum]|uniref:ABC transporter permease n=1 Tax=Halapricum hydrolyticum TaxID=2979991 RepID=A0AAE3I8W9_9EURY|nr:ABC transporter permease [Halapricum hydrolyticum]MCU4716848.1 ABC transporter permease [Halapricum hydrolyticum]MCU4725547.1 ABC transporter permease [Halapricum hydrolyticum]